MRSFYAVMSRMFFSLLACVFMGSSAAELSICMPDKPSPTESTAAGELADYLGKITGKRPAVVPESQVTADAGVIYVGNTQKALKSGIDTKGYLPDQWCLQSCDTGLLITGGVPRGILYGVYHYLEDYLNVRFWTYKEESVPRLDSDKIPLANISKKGEPEFFYRESCSLALRDSGHFAAKLRLTSTRGNYYGQIDPKEKRNFGMESIFGPPNFVHTFYLYIPYNKYFKEHPEYFALIDGKRSGAPCPDSDSALAGTLCLSNAQLRKEMLANLKNFIRAGRKQAEANGVTWPRLYDVSCNDTPLVCQCQPCKALINKYKSPAGLLLEVINELADGVRDEFPEVVVHTYSYLHTTKAPVGIEARENVCVTVVDTDSNLYEGCSAEQNRAFYQRLKAWAKVVPNLRTWVYGNTFAPPRGLPYPNEFNFAQTMKTFRDNGVRWMMQQHESPFLSDNWDYKLWLWAKLAEDPEQDTGRLIREFADGYYGAAGKYFVRYRELLKKSADAKRLFVAVYATPGAFVHLDYDTTVKAYELFEAGEKLIEKDRDLLRRWRLARLPLDRSILARSRILMSEYYMCNKRSLAGYRFDRKQVIDRVENTVKEQLSWRHDMVLLEGDVKRYRQEKAGYDMKIHEKSLLPPARFAHLTPAEYFDFPAEAAFRAGNLPQLRDDPDAESGSCVFWNVKSTEKKRHVDNGIFRAGVYSPGSGKEWGIKKIKWQDIGWKGFKWVKLGKYKLTQDCLIYFFTTWQIQVVVGSAADPFNPDALFEVWARVKLVGKDENNRPIEVGIDRIIILPPKKGKR